MVLFTPLNIYKQKGMTDTIMGYDESFLTRGTASFRVFVHIKSIALRNPKTNPTPYPVSAAGLLVDRIMHYM